MSRRLRVITTCDLNYGPCADSIAGPSTGHITDGLVLAVMGVDAEEEARERGWFINDEFDICPRCALEREEVEDRLPESAKKAYAEYLNLRRLRPKPAPIHTDRRVVSIIQQPWSCTRRDEE